MLASITVKKPSNQVPVKSAWASRLTQGGLPP